MFEPATAGILDEAKSLQIATIGRDGTPHMSTLWFGWLDGDIVAWTVRASQKGVNIIRDPRVACLVELGTDYSEIRGVSMRGTAEVVEDPARLLPIATSIFTRNFPADGQPDIQALVDGGRRIGIVFHFDKVATWDSRGTGRTLPAP